MNRNLTTCKSSNSNACKGVLAYRFSFNGKEKDSEGMGGGGATYDYGFRIYNPQIAKFLSTDPLSKSYPWYTPYQFAGNKPIMAIDIDGLEEFVVVKDFAKSKSKNTFDLQKTSEKKVGEELWGKEIVGYEFKLNNKVYKAFSNQTTFGRDGLGLKPGVEGNFSGVRTLTKADMATLFAYGLDVIAKYESIDLAFLKESAGNGAKLDYKFTLYTVLNIEPNMLIEIDGVTYNANEAGNYIWGALNEYADEVTDLQAAFDPSVAAEIKTQVVDMRPDESHEQEAINNGENYGIKMSEDMNFNQEVYNKVKNKTIIDKSYVKEQ